MLVPVVKNTHQHHSVANDWDSIKWERLCCSDRLESCSKQHWLYLLLWPEYSRQRQEERGEGSISSKCDRNDVGSKARTLG